MASISGVSVIRPFGYQTNHSCGYCNTTKGSSSYYASSSSMTVEHYQALVDRGWRRAGSTYYKPDLSHSCCPHYTIRSEADKFRASKSQRQSINRWNRYVCGREYLNKASRLSPRSREEKRRRRTAFDLQLAVHTSESRLLKRPIEPKTGKPIEPAHKFQVNEEHDSFSEEKYQLFLAYQKVIHKDPESRWGRAAFKSFLCSGIDQKIINLKGVTRKLGSHHQCYRLDGKLIAVAVLDLLPKGVSSVYLFYDPGYEEWGLGKLSALREIAMAQERYTYYYMGYYIATCPKMRYKGAFRPTSILDPESLEWNLLDDTLRRNIDTHHYFSPSGSGKDLASNSHARNSATQQFEPPNAQRSEPTPDIDYTTLELEPDTINAIKADDKSKTGSATDENETDETDETSIPPGSLFQYSIPGVLTVSEVQSKLNIDKWKLLVRQSLIDMEDLQGWQDSDMTDPQSLKGIVAELAAVLGPDVVRGSAVDLFGC